MDKKATVAYVIVNNLGGITSLIQNLILFKSDSDLEQQLFTLDIEGNKNAPAFIDNQLNDITQSFALFPRDNWYYVYGKLAKLLNVHKGVMISNDQYDLIMLRAFNIDRKVIQIVHDEYNLSLSIRFENCIDKFIAHSKYIYDKLHSELPSRKDDIQFIHYGIPISEAVSLNKKESGKLNLLFLGRHDVNKGILDIIEIENILSERGIEVHWNILGKGPETKRVMEQWRDKENVRFYTPENQVELLLEISKNDILVFPSKFEGFPVALLESMSRGCVPIASNLQGGIQEVVIDGITGYKCSINKNEEFANKIELLHKDRELLISMQIASKELVSQNFEVKKQTLKYQTFFKTVLEEKNTPRHHLVNEKIGSRLDQPWIPNFVTKSLRNLKN